MENKSIIFATKIESAKSIILKLRSRSSDRVLDLSISASMVNVPRRSFSGAGSWALDSVRASAVRCLVRSATSKPLNNFPLGGGIGLDWTRGTPTNTNRTPTNTKRTPTNETHSVRGERRRKDAKKHRSEVKKTHCRGSPGGSGGL